MGNAINGDDGLRSTRVGTDYLSGYGEYEDKVEHVRFGSDAEYYVDDRKAIMRVAVYRDGVFLKWYEKVFSLSIQRQMMRMQIAMLKMGGGVTDLGGDPIDLDKRRLCPNCEGFGTTTDMDGDGMMCTWCEGTGFY